jgi:hypothetical protein
MLLNRQQFGNRPDSPRTEPLHQPSLILRPFIHAPELPEKQGLQMGAPKTPQNGSQSSELWQFPIN